MMSIDTAIFMWFLAIIFAIAAMGYLRHLIIEREMSERDEHWRQQQKENTKTKVSE